MNTRIEKKTSSKGTEYSVLIVELIPGYEKQVFLDNADLKILELNKKLSEKK